MDDNRSVSNIAAGLGGSWALPPAGGATNDLEDHGGNGGAYQEAEQGHLSSRLIVNRRGLMALWHQVIVMSIWRQ